MKNIILFIVGLLAAGCSPADVLSQQGSSLKHTDYVQMGVDKKREGDAKKEAEEDEVARHLKAADREVLGVLGHEVERGAKADLQADRNPLLVPPFLARAGQGAYPVWASLA